LKEQCEAFTKSFRVLFDAALPYAASLLTPIPHLGTGPSCIALRFMLLYDFEMLQYFEHKAEVEV
jgi:hypothetical protein